MIKSTILKSLSHIGLALTTCTMVGIAMSRAALALTYSVTDIGTLGGNTSQAFGINDSGQVVGVSSAPDTNASRAFIWDSTNGIQALPSVTPGFFSQAFGINNNGQVVGSEFSNAGNEQAIEWNTKNPGSNNNAQLLAYLGNITLGQPKSVAYAINDNGQVVGASTSLLELSGTRTSAVLWNSTNGITINAPQAILQSDTFGSTAYGINNNGQVVVSSGGGFQSFIVDTKTDLKQLVSSLRGNCEPFAINNNAQIGGYCLTSDTSFVAALWNSPTNVQRLNGNLSTVYGINNNGQLVGSTNNDQRAFLWQNGVATDLNDQINPNSGWILNQARAINTQGQIVGIGQINGQTHAFLLTP